MFQSMTERSLRHVLYAGKLQKKEVDAVLTALQCGPVRAIEVDTDECRWRITVEGPERYGAQQVTESG